MGFVGYCETQTLLLEHLFQGLLNRYSGTKHSVVKSEEVVYTELNNLPTAATPLSLKYVKVDTEDQCHDEG